MKNVRRVLSVLMVISMVLVMFNVTVFAKKTINNSLTLFDDTFMTGATPSDSNLIVTDESYSGTSSFKVGSWQNPSITFAKDMDISDFIDGNVATGGKIGFYLKKTVEDANSGQFEICFTDKNEKLFRFFLNFNEDSSTNWSYYEVDLDKYSAIYPNSSTTLDEFDETAVRKLELRSRGSFTTYIDEIKLTSVSTIEGKMEDKTLITLYDEYVHINTVDYTSPIWYELGWKMTATPKSTDFKYSGENSLKLSMANEWQSYGMYGKEKDFTDNWDNAYIKFYAKSNYAGSFQVSPTYLKDNARDNMSQMTYKCDLTSEWKEYKILFNNFSDLKQYSNVICGVRLTSGAVATENAAIYIDDFTIGYMKETPTLSGKLFVDTNAVSAPVNGDATVEVSTSSNTGNIIIGIFSSQNNLKQSKIVSATTDLTVNVPLGTIASDDRIKIMLFDNVSNLIPMTNYYEIKNN